MGTRRLAHSLTLFVSILFCSSIASGQLLGVGNDNIYFIDKKSNQFTFVTPVEQGGNALAQDRDGTIYTEMSAGYRVKALATVDPQTSILTIVSILSSSDPFPFLFDIRAMAINKAGDLYLVHNVDAPPGPCCVYPPDILYKADIVTGDATRIGEIGNFDAVQGLAFSRHDQLFGWDVNWGLIKIDPSTAETVDVNGLRDYDDLSSWARIQSLVFDHKNELYGAQDNLYRLDPKTGSSTLTGPANPAWKYDVRGLATWPAQKVAIDIKPGNKRNKINPSSRGAIWVAILSDIDFDPLQVRIPTIRFGRDKARAIRHRVKDINRDGLGDLLVRFKIREIGIKCGDTKATLRGKTFLGQRVKGVDSFKTVGC